MAKLISSAIGGAIGTLLRYLVSGIAYKYFEGIFQLGAFSFRKGKK